MHTDASVAAKVAEAFIDRRRISWQAALDSAVSAHDHARVEQFRALESLRADNSAPLVGSRDIRATQIGVTWFATAQLSVMIVGTVLFGVAFDALAVVPASKLLLVLAFATSAIVLMAAETRTRRVQALMNVFLVSAVAFMRPVLGAVAAGASSPWVAALVGVTSRVYPEAFLAAQMWMFALDFPRSARLTRFDRFGGAIVAALWVLGAVLLFANLLGPSAPMALQVLRRNDPRDAFWFLLSVPMVGAVGAIAWRTKRADAQERHRVTRCAAGFSLGLAPFLLLVLGGLVSPSLNRALHDVTSHDWWLLDTVVLTGLMVMPIATAIAVITDRALDVAIVVHRATQYTLTTRVLKLLVASPIVLLLLLLYQQRDLSVAAILAGSRGLMLVSWAAAACVLLALRRQFASAIDRLFGLRTVDHRAEFNAVLDRVRNAREFREAAFTVRRELDHVIDAEYVSILRMDIATPECLAGRDLPWQRHCALQRIAEDVDACIDLSSTSSLFALLPHRDREWVTRHGATALAPVRQRDGKLLAVILVGRAGSGMPLTRDDRWLIASVATLLALAWPPSRSHTTARSETDHEGEREELALECTGCSRVFPTSASTCVCGAALEPASLPPVLSRKFSLTHRIGRGGMGVVYLAEDIQLGRQVAIKTLPAASPQAIADLRNEARAMAGLTHDGLAVIYGIEVWRDTPALIVEYCAGATLADRLARGALSRDAVIDLGRTVLDALAYMHRRGVAHGDIKPSNIGFSAEGRVKLLDFGLMTAHRDALEAADDPDDSPETSTLSGTLLYLPPEAFRGGDCLRHRDLWATAVVLFEAITGCHPFDAKARVTLLGSVAPELSAVLERALANERNARFQSASEFRIAFDSACQRWRSTHEETIGTRDR